MLTTANGPRWAIPQQSIDPVWGFGSVGGLGGFGSASVAWGTAFLIRYVPVAVRMRVIVVKLWFASAGVGTSNCEVGVYNAAGTLIVSSGAIAKTATTDEIVSNITDTSIGPGLYYMALQVTTSTDTFRVANPTAPQAAALGCRTETAGSLGLPATATWTVDQTNTIIPFCGMYTEATPV